MEALKAPPRLPGRGGTSIQRSSMNRPAISLIRGETEAKVSSTISRPSAQLISSSSSAPTGAIRS